MSIEKDNYSLNMPPPVIEPNEINSDDDLTIDETKKEYKNPLDIKPIVPLEKREIFKKPIKKIVNEKKEKPKREMSEKQKKHIENLIKKNKERAEKKKALLLEKQKKKEEKLRLKREKANLKTIPKQVLPKKQEEKHIINKQEEQPKNNYLSDMDKMLSMFQKYTDMNNKKQEELINKRINLEVEKRISSKKPPQRQSNNLYSDSHENNKPMMVDLGLNKKNYRRNRFGF